MSIENKVIEISRENKIDYILHLGAHTGHEIDFYAKLNPKIIYWFEANPELIEQLKMNILRYPNIQQEIFQYAVSSQNAKLKFNLIYSMDGLNTGCSSLKELKHHSLQYPHIQKVKEIEVVSVRIDDFLKENNLIQDFDLINMDIQGSEYDVLSTTKFLFSEKLKNQIFILETTKDEMYEGQKLESDIIDLMNSKGFEKYHYDMMSHNWGDTMFIKNKI